MMNLLVEPVLGGTVLSGHPLLSGHVASPENLGKKNEIHHCS